eukprot:4305673-Amphidinium_carterae.1
MNARIWRERKSVTQTIVCQTNSLSTLRAGNEVVASPACNAVLSTFGSVNPLVTECCFMPEDKGAYNDYAKNTPASNDESECSIVCAKLFHMAATIPTRLLHN